MSLLPQVKEDLAGALATQSVYRGGRYVEGLAVDEAEEEEISYLSEIKGVGHAVSVAKDIVGMNVGNTKQKSDDIHEKAHNTAHKLLMTIPALVVGALTFLVVIAFFDLIRIAYEDIVIHKNNLTNFYQRLPLFIFNVVLSILLIVAIICYYKSK